MAPSLCLVAAAHLPSAPGPQALAVPLLESRWDSEAESIKKPLIHHKAPRAERFRGVGARSLPGGALHDLLRRSGDASSPGTKSAAPLDLTFTLRWGGGRRLVKVLQPPPTLKVFWTQSRDLSTLHPPGLGPKVRAQGQPHPGPDPRSCRAARVIFRRRKEISPDPGHWHLSSRPRRRLGRRCTQI